MRKKHTARSTTKTVAKTVRVKFSMKSGETISIKAYRTLSKRGSRAKSR
jgi:hypothetical protein